MERPDDVAPKVLAHIEADVDAVRTELERAIARVPAVQVQGSGDTAQIFVTPRVKKVFDLAWEEAQRLRDTYVAAPRVRIHDRW